MSFQYLVPVVQTTINDQVISMPKYYNKDLAGLTFASIPYGLEPLALVTLAKFNTALASEEDVYAFPQDLSHTMTDENVATLETYLNAANVPSDQIISGSPFVTALVAIARIHLCAQYIAGSTSQSGSLFANGITLSSPASSVPAISAVLTASVQTAQAPAGVGNVGIGTGGSGGSGGSGSSSSTPFSFAGISDSAPVGEVLDSASQTWAGPISLGGF
jgi:hypothetical protein